MTDEFFVSYAIKTHTISERMTPPRGMNRIYYSGFRRANCYEFNIYLQDFYANFQSYSGKVWLLKKQSYFLALPKWIHYSRLYLNVWMRIACVSGCPLYIRLHCSYGNTSLALGGVKKPRRCC